MSYNKKLLEAYYREFASTGVITVKDVEKAIVHAGGLFGVGLVCLGVLLVCVLFLWLFVVLFYLLLFCRRRFHFRTPRQEDPGVDGGLELRSDGVRVLPQDPSVSRAAPG